VKAHKAIATATDSLKELSRLAAVKAQQATGVEAPVVTAAEVEVEAAVVEVEAAVEGLVGLSIDDAEPEAVAKAVAEVEAAVEGLVELSMGEPELVSEEEAAEEAAMRLSMDEAVAEAVAAVEEAVRLSMDEGEPETVSEVEAAVPGEAWRPYGSAIGSEKVQLEGLLGAKAKTAAEDAPKDTLRGMLKKISSAVGLTADEAEPETALVLEAAAAAALVPEVDAAAAAAVVAAAAAAAAAVASSHLSSRLRRRRQLRPHRACALWTWWDSSSPTSWRGWSRCAQSVCRRSSPWRSSSRSWR
jgi:hypothetical protein